MPQTRLGLNVHGGGTHQFRQIIADQTGGFTAWPIVASTKLTVGHTEEEQPDERGKLIDVLELLEQSMLELVSKQSRKADIDLIMATKAKYFSWYYYVQLRDTNYQHLYIPIVRISRNLSATFGPEKRDLAVKISILTPLGTYSYPGSFPQYEGHDLSIVDNASIIVAPTSAMPTTSNL